MDLKSLKQLFIVQEQFPYYKGVGNQIPGTDFIDKIWKPCQRRKITLSRIPTIDSCFIDETMWSDKDLLKSVDAEPLEIEDFWVIHCLLVLYPEITMSLWGYRLFAGTRCIVHIIRDDNTPFSIVYMLKEDGVHFDACLFDYLTRWPGGTIYLYCRSNSKKHSVD